MTETSDVILEIKAEAKRKKLEGTICTAAEMHNPFDLRRPSGILSLDLATGGGLPAGGMSQIAGVPGIGKNFLLTQYMRECQRLYKERASIAVACFELPFDKDYGRKAGVQLAYDDYEIGLIQNRRAEDKLPPLSKAEIKDMKLQLGQFIVLRGDAAQVFDNMLEIIASGTFQIIGVDSWNTVLPPEDADKTMSEDNRVAGQAGLNTKFMNKYHAVMNKWIKGAENETTIVGISQVRAKMSGHMAFSRPWQVGGAYSMKHGTLVSLVLSAGQHIGPKGKPPEGKTVNWEIAKGKAGCHDGPKGEYVYYYEPPRIDAVSDLVACGLLYGVIERAGAYVRFMEFNGYQKDLIAKLTEDEIWSDTLKSSVIKAAGLNIRYV